MNNREKLEKPIFAHREWLEKYLSGANLDIKRGNYEWEQFELNEHGLYVFQCESIQFRLTKNRVEVDEDLFIKTINDSKTVTFKETVLSIFNSCKEK